MSETSRQKKSDKEDKVNDLKEELNALKDASFQKLIDIKRKLEI